MPAFIIRSHAEAARLLTTGGADVYAVIALGVDPSDPPDYLVDAATRLPVLLPSGVEELEEFLEEEFSRERAARGGEVLICGDAGVAEGYALVAWALAVGVNKAEARADIQQALRAGGARPLGGAAIAVAARADQAFNFNGVLEDFAMSLR